MNPHRSAIDHVLAVVGDSFAGPPDDGLLGLAEMPADWGAGRPVRELAKPFPLTEAWVREDDPRPEEELEALLGPASTTDRSCSAAAAAGCTGTSS